MPTTAELQATPYKRGTKVRLVEDVPGHAAGAAGKVALANGITWKRYWVRFTDGTSAGHIDHHALVKTADYDKFRIARHHEEIEAEAAAKAAAEGVSTDAADAGAGAAASGSGATVNGVSIPQHLLDRSAAARVRLGG